ncbi:hypothetical protein NDU88_000848 [Pleurodeles waltl]|uniref:Uncharacterized protein n=1 Tax=Pleurodeles waltl TaxID=8319 RepID=A0AAV7USB8_PLEWA|nr:hypothetical protein NDU88_000848 [Pleurodeles waltl]
MGTRSPRGRHSEVALTTTDDGAKADWPAGGQRPWIPQEEAANEETATEKTAKEETAKEEAANEAESGCWIFRLLAAQNRERRPDSPSQTPPRHHGNGDAGNITGNPDIRVPEGIERMNGLCARDAKRKENADKGAGTEDERPEDPGRRRNSRETREASDQGRFEVQRRPEG